MSEHDHLAAVTPISLRQRREPAAPLLQPVRVGGREYQLRRDATGFTWLAVCGTNAVGMPDWKPVQPPELRKIEAALFEMAGQ